MKAERQGLAAAFALGAVIEWFLLMGLTLLIYWVSGWDIDGSPDEGGRGPFFLAIAFTLTVLLVTNAVDGVTWGKLTRPLWPVRLFLVPLHTGRLLVSGFLLVGIAVNHSAVALIVFAPPAGLFLFMVIASIRLGSRVPIPASPFRRAR